MLCVCLLTDAFSTLWRGGKWVNEQLASLQWLAALPWTSRQCRFPPKTGALTSLPKDGGIREVAAWRFKPRTPNQHTNYICYSKPQYDCAFVFYITCKVDKESSLFQNWLNAGMFPANLSPETHPRPGDSFQLTWRVIPRGDGQQRSHIHQPFKLKRTMIVNVPCFLETMNYNWRAPFHYLKASFIAPLVLILRACAVLWLEFGKAACCNTQGNEWSHMCFTITAVTYKGIKYGRNEWMNEWRQTDR